MVSADRRYYRFCSSRFAEKLSKVRKEVMNLLWVCLEQEGLNEISVDHGWKIKEEYKKMIVAKSLYNPKYYTRNNVGRKIKTET